MASIWELSMQAKITKRIVDGAATYLIRDTEVKGFALVVTPAGAKSYAVDYREGSGRGSPKSPPAAIPRRSAKPIAKGRRSAS
jgi:hypothetical protein